MLREWRADVAAFQECTGTLRSELRALTPDHGWHTDARASLCIASRHPIVDAQQMDREDFVFAGGSGLVVTWTLAVGSTDTVHVTNLHLETPRAGLASIRRGRLREGSARTNETSFLRSLELDRARRWAFAFNGPHLVLGDFNTPVESRAYQRAWGDWRNAYSRAGLGLGGTRMNGWIRARIDHVLANDAWRIVHASPERDLGSDHLPMRAVLLLVDRGGLATMR
jgi:endonuclease/exonuclease/phosphatase (EEP) superfamily protein YafD